MSSRAQFLNNLSFLASIYNHRADVFLKKAQQSNFLFDDFAPPSQKSPSQKEERIPQKLPPDLNNFFNSSSMRQLKEYCDDHGVNTQDMIDWLNNNQTVLKQYNMPYWDYSGEGFIGSKTDDQGYIQYQMTTKLLKNDKWEPVAFLPGNGNMHPMKIYKEIIERQGIPASSFTKEIGHYGFLVTVLNKLMAFSNEELPQITQQFINQNSEKLAKIRSQFQTEPRELGSGLDGYAFSIGPHRVLKFFKLKYAYESAINAVNRLFKTPEAAGTEAMIYDYGELSLLSSFKIYYYIIEKMAPLDKVMDSKLLDDLLNVINSNIYSRHSFDVLRNKLQDPKNISLVSQEIKEKARVAEETIRYNNSGLIRNLENEMPNVESKAADFFPQDVEKLKAAGKSFKINPNWLPKLIEEMLWKYVTGRMDLHGGNVGVTSFGDFRYFDPAFQNPI